MLPEWWLSNSGQEAQREPEYSAIDLYPEEQLHYDISDAVDEIITLAAKK